MILSNIKTEKIKESYPYEEAVNAAAFYFNGDQLAANVWVNKYAMKDASGNIYELDPNDMHHRIAGELARVESLYPNPLDEKEIYDLLADFRYIVPQGGPMAGIGNDYQVSSLSNCFVIGNEADSYGGILKVDEEQTQLMKRRGGVGHDLSHIRPSGSPVLNSALSSAGIVPFMERYSNSTREVAQDGRRGALMLSISVKHPNVEDFIDAKLEQGKITGANISVRIDDAFMNACLNDKKYKQQFPVDSSDPTVEGEIEAKELWDKIVHNAWKSAEPGILFWDTIIRESIPDCYSEFGFKTVSTNPCGEIPLCPYDSCRLLAINLYSYVESPFTDKASFNYELFAKHAQLALRLMDDIIDLELEKIEKILAKIASDTESDEIKRSEKQLWLKIKEKCIQGRRTGVGITGEGDMLAALGLQYGTDDAIDQSVKVHKLLALNVYKSSVILAKERGAFEIYDPIREAKNPFIKRIKESDESLYQDMTKYGRRNIAMLTIAPTGTTSLMTQTSSGIEPVFMVSYKRRKKINPNDKQSKVSFKDESGDCWEEYHVLHPKFICWLESEGFKKEEIIKFSDEELDKIIQKSPYHNATANTIDWVQKVKMQGAIQKWVDHSISVTVNIPNSSSQALVSEIYKAAWENGCKGVTVYRDGSRTGVLVSDSDKKQTFSFNETRPPKRPEKLDAEIVRFKNNHENWIAVVGLLENKPYEIFTGRAEDTFVLPKDIVNGWIIKEKNESNNNRYDFQYVDSDGYKVTYQGLSRSFDKEYWNYAKLISGILRHGMPLPFVVDLITQLNHDSEHINTWKYGVVRALRKFIPDGTSAAKESCKKCGDLTGLVFIEGCLTCKSCGYSACD